MNLRLIRLNLGAGKKLMKGYINIDKRDLPGIDLIWDLEKTPLPFEKDSVSEIYCSHVLEHIENFVELMEEIHRLCKNKTIVRIIVPYFRYEGSYRDPTHKRFFSEYTFHYFTEEHNYNFYSKARFKVRKVELRNNTYTNIKNFHKSVLKVMRFLPFKKFFNIFFWNVFTEIYFELEVVK